MTTADDWQPRHHPICWSCLKVLETKAEQEANTHTNCTLTD
jgi:hypothetical protein